MAYTQFGDLYQPMAISIVAKPATGLPY